MTAAVLPSSAAGLLTLLADDNDELKHYALVHLNKVVHEFWFQIASYIGSVEALYEDDEFKDRELAALIASKVLWGLWGCRAIWWTDRLCMAVPAIQTHVLAVERALGRSGTAGMASIMFIREGVAVYACCCMPLKPA